MWHLRNCHFYSPVAVTYPAYFKSWYIMKKVQRIWTLAELNVLWRQDMAQHRIMWWSEMCCNFHTSIFRGGVLASCGGNWKVWNFFLSLLKFAWLHFDCLCKEPKAEPCWHRACSKSYILIKVNVAAKTASPDLCCITFLYCFRRIHSNKVPKDTRNRCCVAHFIQQKLPGTKSNLSAGNTNLSCRQHYEKNFRRKCSLPAGPPWSNFQGETFRFP